MTGSYKQKLALALTFDLYDYRVISRRSDLAKVSVLKIQRTKPSPPLQTTDFLGALLAGPLGNVLEILI